MPLIHSKKPAAFSKNVSTEMHAGKPQKQALAIAYSVKRKAEHKKMNHGGEVEGCPLCMDEGGSVKSQAKSKEDIRGVHVSSYEGLTPQGKKFAHKENLHELQNMPRPTIPSDKPSPYAEGGEVEMDEDHEIHDALGEEMMDAIHTKDKKRMMSAIEAMVLSCMDKE